MIRKLRSKFVILGTVSLFLLLIIIVATSSLLNYLDLRDKADMVLDMFQEDVGRAPKDMPEEAFKDPFFEKKPMPKGMSPEVSYESRFFSVLIGRDGTIENVFLERIVSVDEDEAITMVHEALNKEKSRGYTGAFRYCIQEHDGMTSIVFLDCGRKLEVFRRNVLFQTIISFAGLVVIFILLLFFSKRIMKPVEEAYKKQKEFISVAGHELKTPLTIIDADSELIRMELDDDNEWINDISIQTKRLANLTQDLIRLAKLDEINTDIVKIEFPISDVLNEEIQSFQAVAEQQKITINSQVEEMISYDGDEKLLRQLFGIILDNAIKYAMKSTEIKVFFIARPREISLRIQNKTEAISKEQVSKVFDRFYRVEKEERSEKGGYGLGLAIAKQIVELHDGKITADVSEENLFEIAISLPVKITVKK